MQHIYEFEAKNCINFLLPMESKFRYEMGDGLGKDKKGRVEPVPVVVLPPGKSLDHCMKLKEKKMGIVVGVAFYH